MDSQLFSVRTNKSPKPAVAVAFIHDFGGDARATWQDFPGLLAQAVLMLGKENEAYACCQQAADPALEAPRGNWNRCTSNRSMSAG